MNFLIAMGFVMGFRELSMTMLNPFISVYGKQLTHSTPFLCGLALGIYGLTNAIFQIPYGKWSDKIGRRPVILVGLLQLGFGLLMAALTKNIFIFILSRALQGSGAVMAIAYAWIGDEVDDSKKARAMSVAGTIVAIGALIAFGIGPLLYKLISLKYMFLGCSVIILCVLISIFIFIRENGYVKMDNVETIKEVPRDNIIVLLKDKNLITFSIWGFINNYIQSAMFFSVPQYINKTLGISKLWMVFLPGMILGIIVMKVFNAKADKGYLKSTIRASFIILLCSSILVSISNLICVISGSVFTLIGFMCLTSEVPSFVNKLTERENRGLANGILQTFTFLGFFAGSTFSGLLIENRLISCMHALPELFSILGLFLLEYL